jgi:hypothetical protein
MSHIVKKERGLNILTYCNRNLPRAALGTAKKKGRVAPFFSLRQGPYGPNLASLQHACAQCLKALPESVAESWTRTVLLYLKEMKEIHVEEVRIGKSGVRMMCGKMWDVSSMFQNGIGYIIVEDLNLHIMKAQFCRDCTDHPRAQLQILAGADLGDLK